MIRRSSLAVVAVGLLLSCNDISGPDDSTPMLSSQLVDGRTTVATGFYFLQPLANNEVFTGVFDASLSPTVDICLPAGQGCSLPFIARYTMTSGVGSEVVRLGASQFMVNWQTSQFTLVPGTVYRIRVSVGTTALGYADVTLVSNAPKATTVGTTSLVNGSTLPIRFRIEAGAVPSAGPIRATLLSSEAVTRTIGVNGGNISVNSRGIAYTLSIPAGALLAAENITVTPLTGMTNFPLSGGLAAGVNFAPEGLVFYKPATLTMAFPNGSNLKQVYGFGYTADGAVIYLKLDSKNGTLISVPVTHFSGAGAAAASIVDIDALINSVSVLFPSELYPTVMKKAGIQLSEQLCGGPDVMFDCTSSQEIAAYQAAWLDVAEAVMLRWYNDRLKDLLTNATVSDGSLSRATVEYVGGWRGSLGLVYDVTPPASLEAKQDEGDLLLAKGYQASLERARLSCSDSTGIEQFGKIELLLLENFDLGNGTRLPADLDDLQNKNSCTSFRTSGLPAQLARDTTDTLRVEVIRTVGGTVTPLAWPAPVDFRILASANGAVCGMVEGGTSFSGLIRANSKDMDVKISTDPIPNGCSEVAIEISTPLFVPGSNPPPGLFGRAVFGATDTLRVPVKMPSITVTPAIVILSPGAMQQFTATGLGANNGAVTWTTTGGTISSSGLLTAGSNAGQFTVTATSVANSSVSGSAQVTIVANTTVTVSPASAIVAPGGSQQFNATVNGTSNQAVNWSATGGTITPEGLYRAFFATGGPFTVTATSQANPSATGTAYVTVARPPGTAVLVSHSCRINVDGYVLLESAASPRQFIPFTQNVNQQVGLSAFNQTISSPNLQVQNDDGTVSASGSARLSSSVTAGSGTGTINGGTMSGEARHEIRDGTSIGGTGQLSATGDCSLMFEVVNGPIVLSLSGRLTVQQDGDELNGSGGSAVADLSGCGSRGCFGAKWYSQVGEGSQTINDSVTLTTGRWLLNFKPNSVDSCCVARDGTSVGNATGSLNFSFSQVP